mgnify:CR=1 FL=1
MSITEEEAREEEAPLRRELGRGEEEEAPLRRELGGGEEEEAPLRRELGGGEEEEAPLRRELGGGEGATGVPPDGGVRLRRPSGSEDRWAARTGDLPRNHTHLGPTLSDNKPAPTSECSPFLTDAELRCPSGALLPGRVPSSDGHAGLARCHV